MNVIWHIILLFSVYFFFPGHNFLKLFLPYDIYLEHDIIKSHIF